MKQTLTLETKPLVEFRGGVASPVRRTVDADDGLNFINRIHFQQLPV